MNFAVIGAGGFAGFSVSAILETGQFQCLGVYDINAENAATLANRIQAPAVSDLDDLLSDPLIELIYIATPPYLHYAMSKKAILAGKNVICEKPGSLSRVGMQTLIRYAREKDVLFVVDLMQPYNPIIQQVGQIIEEDLLGRFRHGYFENYAGGNNLAPSHWMWNEKKSGGIFVEHAVHFFDLFRRWFGPGKLISSHVAGGMNTLKRNQYDRVQAVVQYGDSWVNFYHGFDQASSMDRQELRLLFEQGDITLYEWIPVKLSMRALVSKEQLRRISEIIEGEILIEHKDTDEPGRFTMRLGHKGLKLQRYKELIQALFLDQKKFIEDRSHDRLVTSTDALAALSMGIECRQKAEIV
jgi:predicted dehydrogenase